MANQDTVFAKGLYFQLPSPNAPSFLKGKLSLNVEEFTAFLKDNIGADGFVSIDLKESKGQKGYAVLDNWQPKTPKDKLEKETNEPDSIDYPEEVINPEDIPF